MTRINFVIVDGIFSGQFADPEKRIKFVGLSLPNIDDQDKVVSWAQYVSF